MFATIRVSEHKMTNRSFHCCRAGAMPPWREHDSGYEDRLVMTAQTVTMTVESASKPAFSDTDKARLAVARDVLLTEADALKVLADALDEQFMHAVEMIAASTGRVVVSGIGKSGHVGRKIAATLSSTGTPALFVHPAEASHGDLGMIVNGDIVLALSNSGETSELADLVAHTRRFGLPLIGVTGRSGSALARAADIVLLLPPVAEACPMGLAPTTSTTLQMALGDALAVALLKRRGFTARDFGAFHPGGRLGAQLRTVGDIMRSGDDMPLVLPDMRMDEAVLLISSKSLGCVGVVDKEGRLIGIVTDGDLRRHMAPDLWQRPVADIMTRDPRTIAPSVLAAEALHTMTGPARKDLPNSGQTARPINTLFVVDETHTPIGVVHIHDLLRAGVA
ncbi:Arabinose-5-phosphate isomerase [Granulibacter bethesdensis]|nr:Arabinose-5-phosphate isomerase [Granulibacter bethesdensis]